MATQRETGDKVETQVEKKAKKPVAKKTPYEFTEENTTVTIDNLSKKVGDQVAEALKGQIADSTDFQLTTAIFNLMRRHGVDTKSAGAIRIKRA